MKPTDTSAFKAAMKAMEKLSWRYRKKRRNAVDAVYRRYNMRSWPTPISVNNSQTIQQFVDRQEYLLSLSD
jgi:hypothetical protein